MSLNAGHGLAIVGLKGGIEHLGVNLGGAELGMTQELLDAGDVHPPGGGEALCRH